MPHLLIDIFCLILSLQDQFRRRDAAKSRVRKSSHIHGGVDKDLDSEEQEKDEEEEDEDDLEIPMVEVSTWHVEEGCK